MRIRTRYTLFKAVAAVAILTFLFSLWDIFANHSNLFIPVVAAYLGLFVLAVLLYAGHKPVLDEEGLETELVRAAPEGAPAEAASIEAIEVVEVPKSRPRLPSINVAGPHHFKCPFCSHLFSLELTHLRERHDFRINCPFCANNIRIPRQPRVTAQPLDELRAAAPSDRALFTCTHCGEVLRITAPGSQWDRLLHVQVCPRCQRTGVVPATA